MTLQGKDVSLWLHFICPALFVPLPSSPIPRTPRHPLRRLSSTQRSARHEGCVVSSSTVAHPPRSFRQRRQARSTSEALSSVLVLPSLTQESASLFFVSRGPWITCPSPRPRLLPGARSPAVSGWSYGSNLSSVLRLISTRCSPRQGCSGSPGAVPAGSSLRCRHPRERQGLGGHDDPSQARAPARSPATRSPPLQTHHQRSSPQVRTVARMLQASEQGPRPRRRMYRLPVPRHLFRSPRERSAPICARPAACATCRLKQR